MNKVMLSGRLTRDPRTTDKATFFTLAVEREYKKEGFDNTDFIDCVAFGKTAEIVDKYMVKGTKVIVEGKWQTGSFTGADGGKRYSNDCLVDRIEFCESKKAQAESKPEDDFVQVELDLDDDSLPFN